MNVDVEIEGPLELTTSAIESFHDIHSQTRKCRVARGCAPRLFSTAKLQRRSGSLGDSVGSVPNLRISV